MELLVRSVAERVALVAEAFAVFFIVIGFAQALYTFVVKGLIRHRTHRALVEARNELGHMLSLSLEFLIGADVLLTAISPGWDEIGKLAAIVGIRTVLNFFLVQELRIFGDRGGRPRFRSRGPLSLRLRGRPPAPPASGATHSPPP
ncbi:MAG: DUF1622 domain-containing protein [Deferrisomatales bacterium]|nr:DUF1622 domain-containing protein [Deferrisomatales bacterium]